MSTVIAPELVVSSWPFRLGTIIYDPVLRIDVASWDLDDLADTPELLPVARALLDPRRPYTKRKQRLIAALADDQELLRAVYQVDVDADVTISPVASDDVERELGAWAAGHGLSFADLALARLDDLLEHLEALPAGEHHRLLADWWETFEIPADAPKPSPFRTDSGPSGQLYGLLFAAAADARDAWRRDVQAVSFQTFSLWEALRLHWAWRLEFADEPRPVFGVLDAVAALLPPSRTA